MENVGEIEAYIKNWDTEVEQLIVSCYIHFLKYVYICEHWNQINRVTMN